MNRAALSELIDRAKEYTGMRSLPNKNNEFAARTNSNGKPWDGSFLEVLFRTNGVSPGVSLVSSTAALSYFTRANRLYRKPQPGDLVFFPWSTDGDGFGPPHVGLVTDTRDWKRFNRFRTVEAQINSGNPKDSQDQNGVFERTRYGTDVLTFARPAYVSPLPGEPSTDVPSLRPSQFQLNRTTQATVLLQHALHEHLGPLAIAFERGKFDAQTKSAVQRFQREIGLVNGDGTPDDLTLSTLARLTGYRHFQTRTA